MRLTPDELLALGRASAAVFRGTEVSSGPLPSRARDTLRNTRLTNLLSGAVPEVRIEHAHHGYARNLRKVFDELVD